MRPHPSRCGARREPPGRRAAHRALAGFWVVAGVLLASAAAAPAEAPPRSTVPPAAPDDSTLALERRVTAYYFYTNMRCNSCRRIEAWSQAAIEGAFPDELASGRLAWRPVNLDDKGNAHYVDDYQLFTKSLIVVEEVGGKQVRWKNLTKVWELLGSMPRFHGYVQDEVRAYLAPPP